jgi:hypothetical protein
VELEAGRLLMMRWIDSNDFAIEFQGLSESIKSQLSWRLIDSEGVSVYCRTFDDLWLNLGFFIGQGQRTILGEELSPLGPSPMTITINGGEITFGFLYDIGYQKSPISLTRKFNWKRDGF